jgi:TRAP-type transport system periplasmic protein
VFAETAGYTITQISATEVERWKKATDPLDDAWVEDMNKRGANGKAMLEDARALINQYSK